MNDFVDPLEAFAKRAKKRWGSSIEIASEIPSQSCLKLSTGNFGLDIATFGGVPRGRISRYWGTPRSAKTGSSLNTIVEWQRRCAFCFNLDTCGCPNRKSAGTLWVDAENKLSDALMQPWMEGHGIDMSAVLFERPDSGDEIIDVLDDAIRQGVGLCVVDSIAHMVSKAEIQKAAEDGELPGRGAKLVNKAMRKWILALTQRGFDDPDKIPTIILINQIRGTLDKYIPETLPGGKGQTFATSLDVRFHSSKSKWRYRAVKDDGSWSDLKKPPTPDSTPDYQETDYRVTTSSVCPAGRYGTYRYWLQDKYGRRKGDPDNAATMVQYMNRYDLIQKIKGAGWGVVIPEEWATEEEREIGPLLCAEKKGELIESFRVEEDVQRKIWSVFIRQLCQ